MIEDEQIKVWREEFESHFDDKLFARRASRACINDHRNSMFHGFVLAKRSMPAIELPEFFDDPDGCQLFSGSVTSAITAAGYKYKIK